MRVSLLLVFVLALLPLALLHAQAPTAGGPKTENVSALPDKVMGSPEAPVTIIEYASLTCPHCAHFANDILPKVTDKYIATGKVKLIYRDFPLDGLALKAATLGQCLPDERYFSFIKTLFSNQEAWLKSENPEATLIQYAKLAGLSDERVKSCLADEAIKKGMMLRRQEALDRFKISSTPSFIVNYKDTISGAKTFEDFDAQLQKAMK